MKCGTSYLFNYLSRHPQVAPSTPKEPEFFTQQYESGLAWYAERFPFDAAKHKVALEASTGYTKHPHFPSPEANVNAAERIRASGIRAKFIYVMRDPIDRIESHYNYGVAMGWGRGRDILSDQFTNCSKYAMQLDEYTARFPRSDILLLEFEDVTKNIDTTAERIFQFLDLDVIDLNATASKPQKIEANRTLGQRAESNLLLGLKQLSSFKEVYRNLLPHEARRWINRQMSSEYTEIRKLTTSEKEQIFAAIAPDINRLQQAYRFDTSRWQTYQQIANPPK